jgi:hypothetical protein
VQEIEGVAGVHVMAYRQEELVAEIIVEAGLLPRRMRKDVPRDVRGTFDLIRKRASSARL